MNRDTKPSKPSVKGNSLDAGQQILEQPLRPGILRICPSCKRWFALVYQRSKPHEVVGPIDYYRCKRCDHEISYARSFPPETL